LLEENWVETLLFCELILEGWVQYATGYMAVCGIKDPKYLFTTVETLLSALGICSGDRVSLSASYAYDTFNHAHT
jgi:hypothetical protein